MANKFVIREARRKSGLSVSALAAQMGVSRAAAANWDSAKSFPRPALIPKLARILGLEEAELRADRPVDGRSYFPSADDDALTASEILADTKRRLARKLSLPETRIELTLTVRG